jgi:beta-mannanase
MADTRASTSGTAGTKACSRRSRRRLRALLALVAIVVASLGVTDHSTSSSAALPAGLYYGVFAGGEGSHVDRVSQFEAHAEKAVAIVNVFNAWGSAANGFPAAVADSIRAHGSIPLITWEPWNATAGPNQPAYSLQQIINGTHDAYIRQWARAAAAWGHPFFLRFAHEMNGDWYPWSEAVNGNRPGQYVQAWRKVRAVFDEEGAANVTWVWCVNKDYAGAADIAGLYPGDAYVDWLALDAYNRGTASAGSGGQFGGTGWRTFTELVKPTYDKLITVASGKPIMVAELGTVEEGGSKAEWFTKALKHELKQLFPRIEAMVYFNHVKTYDNRITSSETARAAFAEGVGLSYYADNTFGDLVTSPIRPLLFDATTTDTMGPFVDVVPVAGAVAPGDRVRIAIDAEDRSGIAKIDLYINGKWHCTEKQLPYECYWTAPTGSTAYTVIAKAFDPNGNGAASSVTIRCPRC